jgi:hypothetical protein
MAGLLVVEHLPEIALVDRLAALREDIEALPLISRRAPTRSPMIPDAGFLVRRKTGELGPWRMVESPDDI